MAVGADKSLGHMNRTLVRVDTASNIQNLTNKQYPYKPDSLVLMLHGNFSSTEHANEGLRATRIAGFYLFVNITQLTKSMSESQLGINFYSK